MKRLVTAVLQNYNSIVYFWLLLFLIPIPVAIFGHDTAIRNFNYVWGLLFLIYFFKNKLIIKIDDIVFSRRALGVFFFCVLISFNYSALAQYYGFHISGLDFSIFDNMIQEFFRGNLGYSTIVGYYHFATHQNYILALLLPLYYLLPYPVILPIILMTSLWFAGILLWEISRLYLSQFWSFLLVLSFYLSPHLQIGVICFCPEMLYPCILFLVAYAHLKNKPILFIIAVFLFFSIKEEAILYGIGFMLWLLVSRHYLKTFIVLFLILVFATLNFLIVEPYFLNKSHLAVSPALNFWSAYGGTKSAIIMYILKHPISIALHMFNSSSGFWKIYPTFLFIPFLSLPVILTSLLPLGLSLSAAINTSGLHILNGYYPAALISLCFIGMLCFIIKSNTNIRKILVLIALITSSLWGSGAQTFYHVTLKNLKDFYLVHNILTTNYANAKICPGGTIYPHLKISEFKELGIVAGGVKVQDFMAQKNCIVVFSEFGDNFPYTMDVSYMVNYAKSHPNCKNVGGIYFCNNYSNK
ncbi:MAG: hypothetical protein K0R14_2101 [Burkholderiales bacterium]|jgi:uncharacterized membrane protein|nr:hypothetical protein [Burkholderiales bacterium]